MSVQTVITDRLRPLVGLPLSAARRAAAMQGFHFGALRPHPRAGNYGAYILHLQCPWRLEHNDRIYVGSDDLWAPSSTCDEHDDWTFEDGNLRDERLQAFLGDWDPATKSIVATTARIVEQVRGTPFGGATLDLSDGDRLVIFPAGSEENWRLLGYEIEDHLVISAGQPE